ncbi:MAG: hypothetical protein OEZ58_09920 [Gammaproteobacteria bacterium]|nr:hypothetical protein [Gammaproteobacteria bacterium]
MAQLEPRIIQVADLSHWLSTALQLILRRGFAFLCLILGFYFAIYAGVAPIANFAHEMPAIVSVSLLFVYTAIIFVAFFAFMIIQSYLSDHSLRSGWTQIVVAVLQIQKPILRLSILSLFIGSFFWVVALTMNIDKSVLTSCEKIVSRLIEEKNLFLMFELDLSAGFLYFFFLAQFALRTFFALPLMLFHEADYAIAQELSQRAIYINIKPMSVVLFSWALLLMFTMLKASIFAPLLLLVFAVYCYVAYRDIFLGQAKNAAVKSVQKVSFHSA